MKLEQQFAEGSFVPPGFFCANDFSSHTSGVFKELQPCCNPGNSSQEQGEALSERGSAFLPLIDGKQTVKGPRAWMAQGPGDG